MARPPLGLFTIPVPGSNYPIVTAGKVYFVDAVDGSDDNDGKTPYTAKKTIQKAYDLTVANQDDTVVLLPGTSFANLTANLAIDNAYTHIVGLPAPTFMNQRGRIGHSANFTPMITMSADGCSLRNLYISHGRGSATNLNLLSLTGSRCYFENVHFAGAQHATEGNEANYKLINITGSYEHYFKNCTFGTCTTLRSAANSLLYFGADSGRCKFEKCLFLSLIDDATAVFVNLGANNSLTEFCWFDSCQFVSLSVNGGTAMTQAIDIPSTHTTTAKILVTGDTTTVGVTDIADQPTFIEWTAYTATANAVGLAISPSVS